MAEEQFGVQYINEDETDTNGVALLTNSGKDRLLVKEVHVSGGFTNGAATEAIVQIQIGKNNAFDGVDGASGRKMQVMGHSGAVDNTPGSLQKSFYIPEGGFELEGGETLYYNMDVTGTITVHKSVVDTVYHF